MSVPRLTWAASSWARVDLPTSGSPSISVRTPRATQPGQSQRKDWAAMSARARASSGSLGEEGCMGENSGGEKGSDGRRHTWTFVYYSRRLLGMGTGREKSANGPHGSPVGFGLARQVD